MSDYLPLHGSERFSVLQGGSNMTGTDLCVNKSQFVPVMFEPLCI